MRGFLPILVLTACAEPHPTRPLPTWEVVEHIDAMSDHRQIIASLVGASDSETGHDIEPRLSISCVWATGDEVPSRVVRINLPAKYFDGRLVQVVVRRDTLSAQTDLGLDGAPGGPWWVAGGRDRQAPNADQFVRTYLIGARVVRIRYPLVGGTSPVLTFRLDPDDTRAALSRVYAVCGATLPNM